MQDGRHMLLLWNILKRSATVYPRKPALIDGEHQFTYEALEGRANRLANALTDLKLPPQSKIAFLSSNRHELVEGYFAVAKTHYVIVPVNARFSTEDALYVIDHSDASVLIYEEEAEVLAKAAKTKLSKLKHVIVLGKEYEELLSTAGDSDPPEQETVTEDSLYMIMYTSGATGRPKGVMSSQRNIVLNAISMAFEIGIGPDDITLLVMPLFHNGGLWPTVVHVLRGGTVILYRGHFDPQRVLEICEQRKVTFLNLVPTMLYRLLDYPDLRRYDLGALRAIMYAGAPSDVERVKEAMKLLGESRFYQALGCTEHNGIILSFPTYEHALHGPLAEKLPSVGRTATLMEVKLVDMDGKEVTEPNKAGEIVCRGNLALGYWKDPKATAETFKDGWLYTGDIGRKDEDGYIYVIDRKKDMIISGGENISSREVEECILRHPAVQEVAVIGVPDPEWGEAVKAIVVLKDGAVATEEEIIRFVKERLASYKAPKSVEFWDALPKNPAGKVMKGEIRKRYWGER